MNAGACPQSIALDGQGVVFDAGRAGEVADGVLATDEEEAYGEQSEGR